MASDLTKLPDDEAKRRLRALSGKTIATAIGIFTGIGPLSEVVAMFWEYFSSYREDRFAKRMKAFSEVVDKSRPDVRAALESPERFEPLVDVFLSVVKSCMNDDEDEKAPFYAALMLGFADPKAPRATKPQKLALLRAMQELRVHDLYILATFGQAHASEYQSLNPILFHIKPEAIPARALVDNSLIPLGLTTLKNYGLVEERVIPAKHRNVKIGSVPMPTSEILTPESRSLTLSELGRLLWDLIEPNLGPLGPPSPTADGASPL